MCLLCVFVIEVSFMFVFKLIWIWGWFFYSFAAPGASMQTFPPGNGGGSSRPGGYQTLETPTGMH